MLPLIYTNLADAVIFVGACLVWNIPEAIGMLKQRAKRSRKDAAIQDQGSLVVLIGLLWVGLLLNFLLAWLVPQAAIPWPRMVLFVLGVILIILGVALRWYSIGTLGGYFTREVAVSAGQTVVRRGPYRWIRHPAYSGTLVTMLGVGLAVTNWAGLVALMTCVCLGHLYRVRIEERALTKTIGQPYLDYSQHTKRFIPLVF